MILWYYMYDFDGFYTSLLAGFSYQGSDFVCPAIKHPFLVKTDGQLVLFYYLILASS